MADHPPGTGDEPAAPDKTYPNRPNRVAVPAGGVDQFAATMAPDGGPGTDAPDLYASTVSPTDPTSVPGAADQATFTLGSAGARTLPDPPAPPPDIPGYLLRDELGRGGMGVVYKAIQSRLNRPVALKMILAGEYAGTDSRVRFLAEAEVVARLQHPNIVQLYEFNVHHGVPYFSLEFVDGGPLSAKLARQPLPPGEAAALVETLARAVHYAHQQGVVHRDLKPANVLLQTRPVDPDAPVAGGGSHTSHRSLHGDASFGTLSCVVRDTAFVPKITDFGLAKTSTAGSDLTRTGAVMGTPSYMAPEQAGGRSKEVGPAADTYALGAILYECLTGRPPFAAATPVDTIMQVLHEDPVPPRRLQSKAPKDLETICLKALHKEPAKRYATTQELADDLARFLTGDPIKARPTGPVERGYRWARRHKALAGLLVVSFLFLGAAAALGWVVSYGLTAALRDAKEQRGLAEARQREADAHAAEADRQAAEATRQKDLVQANLRKRVESVDDILFNMDARLENYTGLDPIRREFLDEVRQLSGQLVKETPDDPQVVRQAGRVYRSVGDLAFRARSYREADTAFKAAVAQQRKLVDRFPDRSEYLYDLAMTTRVHARTLWAANRLKEAREAFAENTKQFEQLAARGGHPDAAKRAARAGLYRANVLEQMGAKPEAVAGYRAALARQEELAKADPKDPDLQEDIGQAAHSLAAAVEADAPDEAARLLRRAIAAHRASARLAPRSERYEYNYRDAYDDFYRFGQRHHRDADLAAVAKEYADDPPDTRYGEYNAACYQALAAKAAGANPAVPEADRKARAEKHAKAAVARLEATIDRTFAFTDRVHLLKDVDWDGLRDRPDFKAVLAKLDKRFPGRPVTPADLLASLKEEYDGERDRFARRQQTAVTLAEKKRALLSRPDFPRFADRVLKLAEDNPTSPAALDGLIWVVETGGKTPSLTGAAEKLTGRALAGLEGYLTKPEFASACLPLSASPTPGGDALLRKAAAGHNDPDVRGLAAYALGLSLAKQMTTARPGSPQQAKLALQSEEQFERVIKEFPRVVYQESTLGALARRKLYEVRSLSEGRQAREIAGVDLAGKEMKLSGRKGRVTLVFFWANWCGYCRQLFPATREWVEQRYKNQPFGVIGVNCDEEKEAATRPQLPWPSWWDGGPGGGKITEEWQIDSFPTLYLIDHAGVIRKKWEGKPDPDEVQEAIDGLLRTAGRGKR